MFRSFDKSSGKYKVLKTIGSSIDKKQIARLVSQGDEFIKSNTGIQELDFCDYDQFYTQVLSSITSHKLVGIDLALGKIFDEIGFNKIEDELLKDLVLYRLVYPKNKLKTTEYLYRFAQKVYSEDDVYRYIDKLYNTQKEMVQQISYDHTLQILPNKISVVFYDMTTIYLDTDYEDDFSKTDFSKEGKHQNPRIVLGLLVSEGGYPLAYDSYCVLQDKTIRAGIIKNRFI